MFLNNWSPSTATLRSWIYKMLHILIWKMFCVYFSTLKWLYSYSIWNCFNHLPPMRTLAMSLNICIIFSSLSIGWKISAICCSNFNKLFNSFVKFYKKCHYSSWTQFSRVPEIGRNVDSYNKEGTQVLFFLSSSKKIEITLHHQETSD